MNNISIAFLLTTLSGLSTLIGIIPIFIKFKKNNRLIAISLLLAAIVIITISITELIPESIKLFRESVKEILILPLTIISVLVGIIISNFIEKKIEKKTNNNLYKIGIISMLVIIIHNIPEGIITFISTTSSTKLGISLAISIALHNLPEGLCIAIPIYYGSNKKSIAILYTLIAALSEPFGALITYLFLLPLIDNIILGLLLGITAGIMINLSIIELYTIKKAK